MPIALSTTKRKFHKILDQISNASNTALVPQADTKNASTTTLPTTLESPAKKARTTRPVSALVTPTPNMPKLSNRTSSTINRDPAASTMPTVILNPEPPNFAPWDRIQFLKRLETFRHVDKWMGKPKKINEVQWARRGWSCVARDTVRCSGGCSQELVIKLEPARERETQEVTGAQVEDEQDEDEWRENALKQLIEAYAEKTVTGHAVGCPWRKRGCDDTVFRLPLYHQANAISSLRQRYESLLTMASELPTNLSTPPNFELSKYYPDIRSVLQRSNTSSNPETTAAASSHPPSPTRAPPAPPINREALTLALFGWQAETGHIAGLATCSSCFRRLGLWLFRTRVSPTGEEKEAPMARLDVVGEHRDYCPWIDALSQNGASSRPSTSSSQTSQQDKAGWELLSRIVMNVVQSKIREETPVTPEVPVLPTEDDISITSTFATATTAVERASRDEKDKERWARLKRLKQAFQIKRGKKKENMATA